MGLDAGVPSLEVGAAVVGSRIEHMDLPDEFEDQNGDNSTDALMLDIWGSAGGYPFGDGTGTGTGDSVVAAARPRASSRPARAEECSNASSDSDSGSDSSDSESD